jgi:hypothetical protein
MRRRRPALDRVHWTVAEFGGDSGPRHQLGSPRAECHELRSCPLMHQRQSSNSWYSRTSAAIQPPTGRSRTLVRAWSGGVAR